MSTAARSSPQQRHSATHPCPVCKGHDGAHRGQGERCHGFVSGDYIHCSREEHAGQAPYHSGSQTWSHKAAGPCACGYEHAPAEARRSKAKAEVVAAYDYRNAAGEVLYQVVRFKPKSFRQRRPDPSAKGGWAWNLNGMTRLLYRLPELQARKPGATVYIVEGERDADRLGKFGLVATTNSEGAGKWKDHYAAELRGANVVILPDNDQAGRQHAELVAAAIVEHVGSVKVLALPDLPEKGDVSDWLDRGRSIADLELAAAEAPFWTPPEPEEPRSTIPIHPEGRWPVIVCGSQEATEGLKTWTPAAMEALAESNRPEPHVFQRGGVLCRLRRLDDDGAPSIEPICLDGLRGLLCRSAVYANEIMTKNGPSLKYGPPRVEIAKDIMAIGDLDAAQFPHLESISETPRFGPDGELILTPGYHPKAKMLYAPSPEMRNLVVSQTPTFDEIAEAKSLIFDDLLVDISFANQASRANAAAVMLLPFMRMMIQGPTPNHHFTASTEGTGKGLCASACAFPYLGRQVNITTQKESEAEWRKAITTHFMSGSPYFFIDNMYNPRGWDDIPQTVDSGTLAAAWASARYEDRILGGNKDVKVKVQSVFMSSGNNVEFSRELNRRIVPIELIALDETPSLRTGFKHDPLLTWAAENRVALARACLTLIAHWVAEGKPEGPYVMGTFESYARMMGGILDACEIKGFLGNRPKAVKSDPEARRWGALVAEWHRQREEGSISTANLREMITQSSDLADLFGEALGDGSTHAQNTRLGKALDRNEGRVWGDHWRITRSEFRTANKSSLWRLRPKAEPYGEDDEATCEPATGSAQEPSGDDDWTARF